jgi:hypothetical protein
VDQGVSEESWEGIGSGMLFCIEICCVLVIIFGGLGKEESKRRNVVGGLVHTLKG